MSNSRRHASPMNALRIALLVALAGGCAAPAHHEEPPLGAGLANTHSVDDSVFQALGGKPGIARLTETFIREIAADERLRPYFRHSNIDRFQRMLEEELCMESGGGCEYTGEDMRRVHAGMRISRADFNAMAEALMRAMDKEGVPVVAQNRIMALRAQQRDAVLRE